MSNVRSQFMLDVAKRMADRESRARPKRVSGIGDAVFNRVIDEVEEAIVADDFSLFAARHWVALYHLMHVRVYGVAPAELVSKTRTIAAARAARMLDKEFAGDKAKFAAYLRWVWNRELSRVEYRKREGKELVRVGWGLCFNGLLLTDYRVAMVQKGGR